MNDTHPVKQELNRLKEVQDSTEMSLSAWNTMRDMANTLVKSRFLPAAVDTPEKAMAIMLAGRELGIGPMEAFRSINVIQGKPTVSPQLMLALANRRGELEDIKIDTNATRCVTTIKRKGRAPHTETFGVAEATALGLMQKDNYKKQAMTMFKWRSLAANLRVTFPDVVLGLYTPEELGADEFETKPTPQTVKLEQILHTPSTEIAQEGPPDAISGPKTVETEQDTEMPETPPESIPSEPDEVLDQAKQPENYRDKPITDKQRRYLFYMAKSKRIDDQNLKKFISENYGVKSTKELKMHQVQPILDWIDAYQI